MLSKKRGSAQGEQPYSPANSGRTRPKSVTRRVLLVDDSNAVRGLIKTLLAQKHPEWEIGEAENGQVALEKTLQLQPDVMLLDLNLPDISSLDAVAKIRQLSPATKIILCSLNDSSHIAVIAKHTGADGHFTKSCSPEELHQTIASVLSRPPSQT